MTADAKDCNVLFIISDQHTRAITGCYGHPMVRTPNMDRLARQGVRFGHAYCPALMDGPAAVEAEFNAKVPELMEAGGYIPAIDDLVMPDMPYASLRRYVELVRGLQL